MAGSTRSPNPETRIPSLHYTPAMPTPTTPDLPRTIGFWGAVAVMVGVIIGSGIFKVPAEISQQISSPMLILGLWVLGGLICLAGALTLAELAAMFPASGGVYVFLREGYGPVPAFVFGWSYLLLIKPFAAGGIAFIFGESLNKMLGVSWDVKVSTTVMLLSLTVINLLGVGLATGVARVLTFIKFGALGAIIVLACALANLSLEPFRTPASLAAGPLASPSLLAALVACMAGILWTYDGWADVGAIAGEVKDPQRQLPRIYILGTLSVIAIYVLVNAAYLLVVPLDEMRALAAADKELSVAAVAMERLLGTTGAVAILAVVLASTLGSSHSSIMTGARVSYAQARDGLLFGFIGHVSPRFKTPDYSLLIQVALSIVAVWYLRGFQELALGFVFTMWIFYGLAGAALFVLRIKRPDAARPFRCPGYPIVPAVFVLASAGMFALGLADKPETKLKWLGVLAAGVPVYYAWRWVTRRA